MTWRPGLLSFDDHNPAPSKAGCLQSSHFPAQPRRPRHVTVKGCCPLYFTKGTVSAPGQVQLVFLISTSTAEEGASEASQGMPACKSLQLTVLSFSLHQKSRTCGRKCSCSQSLRQEFPNPGSCYFSDSCASFCLAFAYVLLGKKIVIEILPVIFGEKSKIS